ncbi:DUF6968 family protein [Croceibacterium ferulae]|uniref:DUF6968 family protein n=1 Tax=Croceibacterium ferulae TaxID=1854641 RepID=UPI000F8928F3|nr:hypothetical protein [Croceibacterium ferulae]
MTQERIYVERSFTLDSDVICCRFFQPITDGQDYSCRFAIDWPDGTSERTIWGVDGIQALLLAMRAAHDELRLRPSSSKMHVKWLDSEGLGLPPASGTCSDWSSGNEAEYSATFLNHLCRVVSEAEAARYSKEGADLLRRAEELFREESKSRHPELWNE